MPLSLAKSNSLSVIPTKVKNSTRPDGKVKPDGSKGVRTTTTFRTSQPSTPFIGERRGILSPSPKGPRPPKWPAPRRRSKASKFCRQRIAQSPCSVEARMNSTPLRIRLRDRRRLPLAPTDSSDQTSRRANRAAAASVHVRKRHRRAIWGRLPRHQISAGTVRTTARKCLGCLHRKGPGRRLPRGCARLPQDSFDRPSVTRPKRAHLLSQHAGILRAGIAPGHKWRSRQDSNLRPSA